jgi:hypothetical protein
VGYITSITLENVRVSKKHVAHVRQCLKASCPDTEAFFYILQNLSINKKGEVTWTGEPSGKWYRDQEFAQWLAKYCESGSIVVKSREGDGASWAYIFDGKGTASGVRLDSDTDDDEGDSSDDGDLAMVAMDCSTELFNAEELLSKAQDALDVDLNEDSDATARPKLVKAYKLLDKAHQTIGKLLADLTKAGCEPPRKPTRKGKKT